MHQPATIAVRGSRIREKRQVRGMSIRELAAILGVHVSYVSKLETGSRKRMSPEKYVTLRDALHMTDKTLRAPITNAKKEVTSEQHHLDSGPGGGPCGPV